MTINPTGSYYATLHLYRMPDGSHRAELQNMAPWVIESLDTIAERFNAVADVLVESAGSLRAQGLQFEEPRP